MKRIILVIILLLTIVAYGCTPSDTSNTDQFRTGTQGLGISFVQNQPPSRIVLQDDGPQDVMVGLELRNLGAHDITHGVLVYSGYDQNLVSWAFSSLFPTLEGKSFSNPQGGKEIKEHPGIINSALIGEIYRPVFQVTACYDYSTRAEIPICIDPDPTGKSVKPCSASSFSASGGQGGPIAVTSVNQEPSPGETLLKITIKNAGGGDVFVGDIGVCGHGEKGLTYKDLDRVKFGSVSLGTTPLNTCKGMDSSGNIPLTNGQGVIFCTVKGLTKGSSYKTTLNVVLDYSYRTSTSKNIEIVKLV
ncbi:MAG: hypothetical protein AABX51_07635 [Nanoarchaeota archaeon]